MEEALALEAAEACVDLRKVTRVTPRWGVLLSAWPDKLVTRTSGECVSMSRCKSHAREHARQLLRLRQGPRQPCHHAGLEEAEQK